MILLLLLIISTNVSGAPYVDFGISIHDNKYDAYRNELSSSTVSLPNPLGTIEFGYCKKSWCGYYSHISSIPDKHDNGLNMIGVKVRIFGE